MRVEQLLKILSGVNPDAVVDVRTIDTRYIVDYDSDNNPIHPDVWHSIQDVSIDVDEEFVTFDIGDPNQHEEMNDEQT